jgi:hypothetical protein
MPARDIYHDAVKSALIKDNWVILADPYRIQGSSGSMVETVLSDTFPFSCIR